MYYVYCTVLYMDVIMLFYKTKFYKVERDKGVYTVVYNVYCIMYIVYGSVTVGNQSFREVSKIQNKKIGKTPHF